MTEPRIEVHATADELATAVAGALLARLADLQTSGVEPHVVLTGGGIADAVHREVARLAPGSGVDWSRVDVWFGDERIVEPDSDDRNVLQARRALLDAVDARVHEVPATDAAGGVDEAAAAYADELRAHGPERFDVLMLGIGPDGHVASLFPHHPGLDVTGVPTLGLTDSPKPPPPRVSLTFETLNRASLVWFLASGDGKAEAVARALAPDGDVHDTPARGVRGQDATTWFLDRAAASHL